MVIGKKKSKQGEIDLAGEFEPVVLRSNHFSSGRHLWLT